MRLIIIGYDAIGDWISYNGLIRYLLKFYNKIYLVSKTPNISELFIDENRVEIFPGYVENKDEYDELNLMIYHEPIKHFLFTNNFFSHKNKIGKYFNVSKEYIDITPKMTETPVQIFTDECLKLENNSTAFYLASGLSKEIKFQYFYFKRNPEKENILFNKLNLENKIYDVICHYEPHTIKNEYIQKLENTINLHNLSNFFDVLKVIEEAREIHLIENSVALFIYHLQVKNLLKENKVYLHAYSRKDKNRTAKNENDSNIFIDMLLMPKLKNWEILYE